MISLIYSIIKKALVDNVPAAKVVDLDLNQYGQSRDDAVRITPAIYIRLGDPVWNTLPGAIQRGVLDFTITIVSLTAYGDDRDILDTANIDHLAHHDQAYKALMNTRYLLSYLPDFAVLLDTPQDRMMIETVTRVSSKLPAAINNLFISTQNFRAVVYDYSAMPEWTAVLASLDLHVYIVKYLDDPIAPPPPPHKVYSYEGTMVVGDSGDDVPEIGYRLDSYGSMSPAFPYETPKGAIFIYWEQGAHYLFVSAPVEELQIGELILTGGTIEGEETNWLLADNPFPPSGSSVDIKMILQDNTARPEYFKTALFDSMISIIEDDSYPSKARHHTYLSFQDIFQDEDMFVPEYTSPSGSEVRRHVTHIGQEVPHNMEVAIFLCNQYGYNCDLLERANTPGRRYVDMLIRDQNFILEVKTMYTGAAATINNKYLCTAKMQHRYSKHKDTPLWVFLDNMSLPHEEVKAYLTDYFLEHERIRGFFLRTGTSCEIITPS